MATPVTRMDRYRESGKAFTNIAISQDLLTSIDAIKDERRVKRSTVVADALALYVEHYPAIKRATEIQRAWCYGDVERVIALQGALTDAEYAARLGLPEREWVSIRKGENISFAVLRFALEQRPALSRELLGREL